MIWISVKEKMPDSQGYIVIGYKDSFGNKLQTVGIYTGENFIDEIGKRHYLKPPKATVTHWAYLPSPQDMPD